MITRELLTAVTGACGAALLIGACASPTDTSFEDDPAQASLGDDESAASTSCAPPDAEKPEQGVARSELRARDCYYGDSWHCTIAHQGWRWVPLEDARQLPPGMGTRCCVRVGPETRPRPGRVV